MFAFRRDIALTRPFQVLATRTLAARYERKYDALMAMARLRDYWIERGHPVVQVGESFTVTFDRTTRRYEVVSL